MLIKATRNLSKGRMRYGHVYEVDDDEGQRLIDANLAVSAETLAGRDPKLAELLIAMPAELVDPPPEFDIIGDRGEITVAL